MVGHIRELLGVLLDTQRLGVIGHLFLFETSKSLIACAATLATKTTAPRSVPGSVCPSASQSPHGTARSTGFSCSLLSASVRACPQWRWLWLSVCACKTIKSITHVHIHTQINTIMFRANMQIETARIYRTKRTNWPSFRRALHPALTHLAHSRMHAHSIYKRSYAHMLYMRCSFVPSVSRRLCVWREKTHHAGAKPPCPLRHRQFANQVNCKLRPVGCRHRSNNNTANHRLHDTMYAYSNVVLNGTAAVTKVHTVAE